MSKLENLEKKKEENLQKQEALKEKMVLLKRDEKDLAQKIKTETEKERNHRNIVWGSHLLYILRDILKFTKEELAMLSDADVKSILNEFFNMDNTRRGIGSIVRKHVTAAEQRENDQESELQDKNQNEGVA